MLIFSIYADTFSQELLVSFKNDLHLKIGDILLIKISQNKMFFCSPLKPKLVISHSGSLALEEVEIERATSPIRLLPGEGLPPTPAPQLRPAFFPEGRHSPPLGAPPVTPAPYAAHQQAAPGNAYPIVGPTPAAFIAQQAVPAVPYARSPVPAAPYVESKPAAAPYPAPYAATPAPYVAKPAPYAATPAPYVAAATPAPYVASPAPSYVTPAPYVTATLAPYAAGAPAFHPKTDVSAYSTLINFGPQEGAAVPPPPPPPPPAPVAPSPKFNFPGPALDFSSLSRLGSTT
jgi:hypothetical protein